MTSFKCSIVVFLILLFSCSEIKSISIENAPDSVLKGRDYQLKAIVLGEGSVDTTLNWNILESVSKGTLISKDGLLLVDREEKSPTLTVKVYSVKDTSKSSSVSIKVIKDKIYFWGKWILKDNNLRELTLFDDLWLMKYSQGQSYIMKDLKWTAIKNDDVATKDEFTDGYIITGTADRVDRIDNIVQGQLIRCKVLINNDNSKLLRIQMEPDLTKRSPDVIFTRVNL